MLFLVWLGDPSYATKLLNDIVAYSERLQRLEKEIEPLEKELENIVDSCLEAGKRGEAAKLSDYSKKENELESVIIDKYREVHKIGDYHAKAQGELNRIVRAFEEFKKLYQEPAS